MNKFLVALAVLLVINTAPIARAAVPTNGEVVVHDYMVPPNDTNCTTDVTAKLNQAAADLLAMQHAGNGADMKLGAGCYRITGTFHVGTPPGDGTGLVGAHVYGAGPNNTIIRSPSGGVRAMQLSDCWRCVIEGFGLQGPGAAYTGTKGLVVGARHVDLGTHSTILRNIDSSGYGVAIQFGDDYIPYSAAAEIIVESVNASVSQFCYRAGQWNTLDLIFIRDGASECTWGWHMSLPNSSTADPADGVGSAGQVTWIGGSATKNVTDFGLYGYNYVIQNFRSEPRGQTGPRIVGGFGGNANLTIDQFLTSTDQAVPIAMRINNGMHVEVSRSLFAGGIVVDKCCTPSSSLIFEQNGIYVTNGQPFRFFDGTTQVSQTAFTSGRFHARDNWLPNALAGGTPVSYFANVP